MGTMRRRGSSPAGHLGKTCRGGGEVSFVAQVSEASSRSEDLEAACPYYFLLRDLWSPRYRRPGTLPAEYLPGSAARAIPDGRNCSGEAAQNSHESLTDAYYDVSALQRKLKLTCPDPNEDMPPPSQNKVRADRQSSSTPPPPSKRHKPFDSSYVPLHLPSSFFDGPHAKPGFEYHDPIDARRVTELFEGARAIVPKLNRFWKESEKFVLDPKLADERVMRHTNLRCFAAAYRHPVRPNE